MAEQFDEGYFLDDVDVVLESLEAELAKHCNMALTVRGTLHEIELSIRIIEAKMAALKVYSAWANIAEVRHPGAALNLEQAEVILSALPAPPDDPEIPL